MKTLQERLEEMIREKGLLKERIEIMNQKNEQLMHINDELTNYIKPTENEYLKNVLFRYMTEREHLGNGSIVSFKQSFSKFF